MRDIHHLFYPRRHYTSSIERAFRNLSCNTVEMNVTDHRRYHNAAWRDETLTIPKPTHDQMCEAIRRCRQDCYGKCRLSMTYNQLLDEIEKRKDA